MITLNITGIRPGKVDRGWEEGRGKGVFDRWEADFLIHVGPEAKPLPYGTKVIIVPFGTDPPKEAMMAGMVFQRTSFRRDTWRAFYRRT